MAHTPGPWYIGKEAGCVVTSSPIEGDIEDSGFQVEHYGGNLIAESIHREDDRKLIAAAPEMAASLKKLNKVYNTAHKPEISSLREAEMWTEVQKIIDKIKPAKQYITFAMAIQHLADGKKIGCDYKKETIIINPGSEGLIASLNRGTHTESGGDVL
ncbi:hypothetical protein [Terribacillus sp. DMT04]|uniref:hypothetical protein n=1 Tax=Terribacillus sp. DMT04 TaxID=2850441 RepID=UPI001C2C95A8|nr:hypothetical protein [Terribacillus sp. DMT04]QXE02795.1 hypothetical protein KS242_06340 [Terribacillus sp. DMT04]